MRKGALKALACPSCLNPLSLSEESAEASSGELRCAPESLIYRIRDGVPLLVRPQEIHEVESFEASYSQAWGRAGWGVQDEDWIFGLPYEDATERHTAEWQVKARSMDALLQALEPFNLDRILDLGGGVGWLSHHLAKRGYEVFEVDAIRDNALGLGAAGRLVERGPFFERIWGQLERPPFRDGALDAVICNASLHYAHDLHEVLEGVARVLRPGGLLAVMNSPVHRDQASANRAQQGFRDRLRQWGADDSVSSRLRHFTASGLERAIERAVGPVQYADFDPGRAFRLVRWLKGLVLGMDLASFPLLLARRTVSET